MPPATAITTRGRSPIDCRLALRMKYRSIASQSSKSVMTPSLSGRSAIIESGVRPSICRANLPTAVPLPRTRRVPFCSATNRGFFQRNAHALDGDECVRRPQIDGQIGTKPLPQPIQHPCRCRFYTRGSHRVGYRAITIRPTRCYSPGTPGRAAEFV